MKGFPGTFDGAFHDTQSSRDLSLISFSAQTLKHSNLLPYSPFLALNIHTSFQKPKE